MSMTNDFDLVPNLLQKLIRVVIKKLLGRITNLVVVTGSLIRHGFDSHSGYTFVRLTLKSVFVAQDKHLLLKKYISMNVN